MSATKRVLTGGVIPPHIFSHEGKLVNAEISERNIEELQWYAHCEKFDLEAECLRRYGYKSEWLTYKQWREIFDYLIHAKVERIENTPKHWHRCTSCRSSQMTFDRHCEGKHPQGDVDEECYECRKGLKFVIRRPGL